MSCSQDTYYETAIVPSADPSKTCGAAYGIYKNYCGTYGQPSCCPAGYTFANKSTSFGSCTFGPLNTSGVNYLCTPNQPTMDQTAQINCCLNQNLPNNNPNGYCASGWCPNSQACQSLLTNYCQGNNLKSNECKQFCRSNSGKCDQALINYCGRSSNFKENICGCALPSSQYPLSNLKTPNGLQIPITCDRRCDVNVDAIRLQGQQDCKIGAICVINLNDVNVVANNAKTGIVIDQHCGNTGPVTNDNLWKKYKWIFVAIIVLVLIFLVAMIVLLVKDH